VEAEPGVAEAGSSEEAAATATIEGDVRVVLVLVPGREMTGRPPAGGDRTASAVPGRDICGAAAELPEAPCGEPASASACDGSTMSSRGGPRCSTSTTLADLELARFRRESEIARSASPPGLSGIGARSLDAPGSRPSLAAMPPGPKLKPVGARDRYPLVLVLRGPPEVECIG
jgi:hypothetical protein